MNENLGAKGGKRDRRITIFHKKRKKKKAILEEETKKEIMQKEKIQKTPILPEKEKGDISSTNYRRKKWGIKPDTKLSKEEPFKEIEPLQKEENLSPDKKKENPVSIDDSKEMIEEKKQPEISDPIKKTRKDSIQIEINKGIAGELEKETFPLEIPEEKNTHPKSTNIRQATPKKGERPPLTLEKNEEISPTKEMESIPYLEKEIIHVLDENIKDIQYDLKKLDSEVYTIKKKMNQEIQQEEVEELELEIENLIIKIETLKKEMESLKKTFALDFPVEVPDNYLIYLVDEYKDKQIERDYLEKRLNENKEYLSLVEQIILIEKERDTLSEKVKEKKDKLELNEEEIQKLNEEVISLEDSFKDLEKLMETQEKILKELESKVNDTVHITERVEFISRTIEHSIIDLFLLMATLKHNLSLKGNALAAVQAAITLDFILKLTTPIEERVKVKENDLVDYKNTITNSIMDVDKLNTIVDQNIESIIGIRHTFLQDYKEYSYLDSYQNALKKLEELENNMKDRKGQITRIGKDMERQLEKNEAKVKQYGTI